MSANQTPSTPKKLVINTMAWLIFGLLYALSLGNTQGMGRSFKNDFMIVTGEMAFATPCWLLGYLIVKVTPLNQQPPVLRAGLTLLLSFILASVFLST